MYIVVGLGNPGIAYRKSRHNAGFQALDALAGRLHIRVTKRGFSALYGEGIYRGERVVLAKPQTYMNLSGDAVQKLVHFYKVPLERLIVLYDDIDLPAGSLRIRANGSAGSHNGMRSVIACAGGESMPRIRIGVGNQRDGDLKDYVLGKPSKPEQALLDESFEKAADAAALLLEGRIADAQALYNRKHEGAAKE